jgi:hypothetical protein
MTINSNIVRGVREHQVGRLAAKQFGVRGR